MSSWPTIAMSSGTRMPRRVSDCRTPSATRSFAAKMASRDLTEPVITEAARTANSTDELGVDGRTRFLTNVMGTWLISETLRQWERDGDAVDLVDIVRAAADVTGPVTVFDVQDPRFLPPGDMPTRVAQWCGEHGVAAPADRAGLMRSIGVVHDLARFTPHS